MMITTHLLVGGLVGLAGLVAAPEHLLVAVLAGMAGGLLPDLDMVFEHRRTLHFPLLATIAGIATGSFAVLLASDILFLATVFWAGMALHSFTDILGEGRVLRHWEESDPRASYDHLHGRWIEPRRWIPTGTVEDLIIALLAGGILLVHVPGLRPFIILALCVSVIYTVTLKRFADTVAEDHESLEAFIKNLLGIRP